MDNEWRTIDLDRGDDGMRVDRVLLRHLRREKSVSRNRIQKWIEAGQVLVNGVVPPRAAWRVQPGDDLQVRVAEIPTRTKPQAQAIELDVLYEDDDLLAVNKPAGLVVHPSFRNLSGTLMNGLLDRARAWPPGSKPALLGRLDKLTSGIVLVTKRTEIYTALQRTMDARRVDKDYLAIVRGKPSPQRGTINLALGDARVRRCCNGFAGLRSSRVLAALRGSSVLTSPSVIPFIARCSSYLFKATRRLCHTLAMPIGS